VDLGRVPTEIVLEPKLGSDGRRSFWSWECPVDRNQFEEDACEKVSVGEETVGEAGMTSVVVSERDLSPMRKLFRFPNQVVLAFFSGSLRGFSFSFPFIASGGKAGGGSGGAGEGMRGRDSSSEIKAVEEPVGWDLSVKDRR
jgi:hypothetical protein